MPIYQPPATAGTPNQAYNEIGTTEVVPGYMYPTFRQNLRGTISLASGTVSFYGFTAGATMTFSRLGVSVGPTAAAGVTTFRMGLYTYNTANGSATLVASTPNTTTALTNAYSPYQVNLSANYQVTAGQRYMGAVIVVADTMPLLNAAAGSDDYGNNNYVSAVQPRLVGMYASQTDLPASVTEANFTSNGNAAHVLMVV